MSQQVSDQQHSLTVEELQILKSEAVFKSSYVIPFIGTYWLIITLQKLKKLNSGLHPITIQIKHNQTTYLWWGLFGVSLAFLLIFPYFAYVLIFKKTILDCEEELKRIAKANEKQLLEAKNNHEKSGE